MGTLAGTAICKHCGRDIWLSMAGWIHNLTDARFCVIWNKALREWETPGEPVCAEPRLTENEEKVLRALLSTKWQTTDVLVVKTGNTIKGVRRTCYSLENKGMCIRSTDAKGKSRYKRIVS